MPKLGMEPIRRDALVKAAIGAVGRRGSLDVTVGEIAREAGVSPALAHHYFGGKEQIFLAAMRRILADFGAEVRRALAEAEGPRGRLEAIVRASFSESCFAPEVIRAWMSFYAQAEASAEARRLLALYQRRLRSNLTHALRPVAPEPEVAAEMLGALIDGLYLRAAFGGPGADRAAERAALALAHRLAEVRE